MSTKFHVIDGECRVRASLMAGVEKVPCIVLDKWPSPAELLEIRLGIDINRSNLKPLERAAALAEYVQLTGLTLVAACKKAGISQSLGSKLVALSRLAPELQRKVNEGWDLERAYLISQEADHDRQRELAALSDLTREQLRQTARGNGQPVELKSSVSRFALPNGIMITVQGPRMALSRVIQALSEALRQLKAADAQGLDVVTASRVLRDRAKAPATK